MVIASPTFTDEGLYAFWPRSVILQDNCQNIGYHNGEERENQASAPLSLYNFWKIKIKTENGRVPDVHTNCCLGYCSIVNRKVCCCLLKRLEFNFCYVFVFQFKFVRKFSVCFPFHMNEVMDVLMLMINNDYVRKQF
jgi:hypothetical protein